MTSKGVPFGDVSGSRCGVLLDPGRCTVLAFRTPSSPVEDDTEDDRPLPEGAGEAGVAAEGGSSGAGVGVGAGSI